VGKKGEKVNIGDTFTTRRKGKKQKMNVDMPVWFIPGLRLEML
jgi:hypothetical protein